MIESTDSPAKVHFWKNPPLQMVTVFIAAFLLRVVCILHYGPILTNDSTYYLKLADGILNGEGLGLPSRVLPAYPIFVAAWRLISDSHWLILWAQALMGAITCVVLFATCRRLFQPPFAFCCGLAVSMYIPLAAFTALLLRETMIAFAVSLTTYCLTRLLQDRSTRWAWATGMSYVLTVFAQPTFVPFLVVMGLAVWLQERRIITAIRFTAPVAVCLAVTIGAWTTRNYLVTQHFIPFAGDHIGCYFLEGIMDANFMKGDKGLRADQIAHLGISPDDSYNTYTRLRESYIKGDIDTKLRDGPLLFARAFRLVAYEPARYLLFSLKRLHRLWMKDLWVNRVQDGYLHLRPLDTFRAQHNWLGVLLTLPVYLFAYSSILAMALYWKRAPTLLAPIVTVLGLHMWIHAETRYALAIHPHLLMLSLVAVGFLWQKFVRHKSRGEIEATIWK